MVGQALSEEVQFETLDFMVSYKISPTDPIRIFLQSFDNL
jgi:hypothetical protein